MTHELNTFLVCIILLYVGSMKLWYSPLKVAAISILFYLLLFSLGDGGVNELAGYGVCQNTRKTLPENLL